MSGGQGASAVPVCVRSALARTRALATPPAAQPSQVSTASPPPPPTITAPLDGESPALQPVTPPPTAQDLQAAYAALQRSRRTLQESTVVQPLQDVLAHAEQDTWKALQARKPVMARMTSTRAYLDRKQRLVHQLDVRLWDAPAARHDLRELQRLARRETGRLSPPSRSMPPEVEE